MWGTRKTNTITKPGHAYTIYFSSMKNQINNLVNMLFRLCVYLQIWLFHSWLKQIRTKFRNMMTVEACVLESEGVSTRRIESRKTMNKNCQRFVENYRVQWYIKAIKDLNSPAKSGPSSCNACNSLFHVHVQVVVLYGLIPQHTW